MTRFAAIAIFIFFSIVTFGQKDTNTVHIDSVHSPKTATIMSVVLPGLGQIYNDIHKPKEKKSMLWWKLPLIYGGVGASTFFAIQNQKEYKFYREERLALQNNDSSYYSVSGFSDSQLKSITDQYSRWRDFSIVAGLAVYLLNIIDANVSGTLLHFDSSDDLSISISPKVFSDYRTTYTGLSISLLLKDNSYKKTNFSSISY